jgi:hypothetical protein
VVPARTRFTSGRRDNPHKTHRHPPGAVTVRARLFSGPRNSLRERHGSCPGAVSAGARTKSGPGGDRPRGCLCFGRGEPGTAWKPRTESDPRGPASPFPHTHRPMFGPIFVKSDRWPNNGLQVALFFGGDGFFQPSVEATGWG